MNFTANRRKLLLAAAAAPLTSCSRVDSARWIEEVKLHDGRLVQLQRGARCYRSGFPVDRRGANIDFTILFKPLNASWKCSWTRSPCSFEIFDGTPYIATIILDTCGTRPDFQFSAQFFKLSEKGWVDVPQNEYPVAVALQNLLVNVWPIDKKDDPKGLLQWSKKGAREGLNPDKPYTVEQYLKRHGLFCSNARS